MEISEFSVIYMPKTVILFVVLFEYLALCSAYLVQAAGVKIWIVNKNGFFIVYSYCLLMTNRVCMLY